MLCSPSTPIPSSGVVEASGAGLVLGLGPGHGHGHVVGQLGEEGGGLSCPTRCSSSKSIASEAVTGSDAIEITHEEGLNSEAGGGGAYLEVPFAFRLTSFHLPSRDTYRMCFCCFGFFR